MQILKRKNGITLVALIITIIVLLILAGVSLSFVFNGGILDKSQQAVNEYENASQKEQDLLDKIDQYLENELGEIANDEPKVPSVDENGLAIEDTTIVAKDDPNIQIVIPEGFAPVILMTDRTDSLPGENGAVKEIMPAEEWNNITKENINKGIVIVDNEITYDGGQPTGIEPDFNEYVWIPMPDSSKFARVAWDGLYYTNSWQNGIHPLGNAKDKNDFWEETSSAEYIDMVDSVNLNKGFYISRYEASQKDNTTAQSKRGQNPWINVSQTTSITASTNMNTRINSHLIYGIEWDSVSQWILNSEAIIGSEDSENTLRIITIDDIQKDSKSWGNYLNSIGGAKINSGNGVMAGGTNEYWKANNIYDLAGNAREWTQEKYFTGTNRAARGGGYSDNANSSPESSRGNNTEDYISVGRRI